MIDLKQLNYFLVSADVSSFSEAAKILYTTQSNISKAILALEKNLGVKLFYREARGISLTPQGRNIYHHARRILDGLDELENMTNTVEADWLNISSNPSSWFARRFADFYNEHYDENLHCRVQNAGTGEILARVRDCKDEIGFVFVMGGEEAAFQYNLQRHHLNFEQMATAEPMLYLGQKHPGYEQMRIKAEAIKDLRYVQMYQDEFMHGSVWKTNCNKEFEIGNMDVAVVTNSDYIMETMLTESPMANLSGSYFSPEDGSVVKKGIPLQMDGGEQILFGMVSRQDEELSRMAQMFADHIRQALKKSAESDIVELD